MNAPYRSTPVFDETTLPEALRREHRTKAGTWGVIHVLDEHAELTDVESCEQRVTSECLEIVDLFTKDERDEMKT